MLKNLHRLLSGNPLSLALAPIAIALTTFQIATPPARADFSVIIDGGVYIRVGQPQRVRYEGTDIYRGRIDPYYSTDYNYPNYYPHRQGVTIRNSTLINPTIIDSRIENSTLIDPVIINSPNRIRTRNGRSPRVRGVMPGQL